MRPFADKLAGMATLYNTGSWQGGGCGRMVNGWAIRALGSLPEESRALSPPYAQLSAGKTWLYGPEITG